MIGISIYPLKDNFVQDSGDNLDFIFGAEDPNTEFKLDLADDDVVRLMDQDFSDF